MTILVVRLGALGDLVHTIPAVAALRRAFPDAQIHWLVEAKHRTLVDLVTAVDRVIPLEAASMGAWTTVVRTLRATSYDLAIDFQGLMKTAILARASGAARVIGFSIWHVRQKNAPPWFSDPHAPDRGHVIDDRLRLLGAAHVTVPEPEAVQFPLAPVASPALEAIRAQLGSRQFALVNAGAAWPSKRWIPGGFGEVAAFLQGACGLAPVIVWGPGEEALAHDVAGHSSGSAIVAPPTDVADLVALSREAALVLSGDTGPLHIAIAVGARTVSIFGPTDPSRTGPIDESDIAVSQYEACECQYDRRCHQASSCLSRLGPAEVCAAIQRRLNPASGAHA